MEIKRVGSQPSGKGPAEWFSGTVRIDPLLEPPAPARAYGASVTFEPGARTVWHTHPLGQTLIVTAGCAAPAIAMTHIAIQEKLDGKAVDWLEKVSDEQYHRE
jgi:quercetin dioxygenase-like cupin family protein